MLYFIIFFLLFLFLYSAVIIGVLLLLLLIACCRRFSRWQWEYRPQRDDALVDLEDLELDVSLITVTHFSRMKLFPFYTFIPFRKCDSPLL